MGEDPIVLGSDLPTAASSYSGPVLDTQHLQSHTPSHEDLIPLSQHLHNDPQQGLNAPFDMAQPQGQVRPGPYNMGALSNALPQVNYRQGYYNPNPSQLRYNPVGPPSGIVAQTQHMPQYGAAMGHMPHHSYYAQQHSQMPPYYGSPISPSQAQSNMSPRPNMQYYGNQIHQPHPSLGYYYAQMPHFAQQGQNSHQGTSGSYLAGTGVPHDPRLGPNQVGDTGDSGTFSPTTQQELRRCES